MKKIIDIDALWKDRPKSGIIERLLKLRGATRNSIAKALGITTNHFNVKLCCNRMKFEDIVTIADLCDYDVAFIDRKDETDVRIVDPRSIKRGETA